MHGFVCALGLQTNRSDSMIFYLLDLGQQRETRLPSVSARRPPGSRVGRTASQHSVSLHGATFRQPRCGGCCACASQRRHPASSHGAAVRVPSAGRRPSSAQPPRPSRQLQAWPSGLLEGSVCFGPVLSCCDRGSWELPDVKRLFCLHD